MIKNNYKKVIAVFFSILGYVSVLAQGTLIDFSTIPKSGTILIYAHSDDDLPDRKILNFALEPGFAYSPEILLNLILHL